jgi:hypothetical protein
MGSLSIAWATAGAALAIGCSATLPGEAGLATGAVVMDWTIDGTKDPAQCRTTGADAFHVSLYGSGGVFAGEYVEDCAAFATTIDGLAADQYTGTAELLDSSGNARTTSVSIEPFDVVAGRSVVVGLEFPSDSFY